jgi:hypothetical protein
MTMCLRVTAEPVILDPAPETSRHLRILGPRRSRRLVQFSTRPLGDAHQLEV